MAACARTAAASCSVPQCTYDVFLSFRGKDTRTTFTDHLYTALKQAGFHTFRDDDEIERGEKIAAELQKAIGESKISIVVFSKNYASSSWCLDELVMIMKRRSVGHTVLPIFYRVRPSDVRNWTGSFASPFSKHKRQLKKEVERVNKWKAALKEVADLGGMELKNRHESHFIQDIIREIQKKFNPRKLDVPPHLVGISSIVKEINSWLQDGTHDAAIATIYGIGGVGKTTIAKIVYNENCDRFESSSFVANVRESSKEPNGLACVQNQLLSDLSKGRMHDVYNKDDGIVRIQHAMCCKQVLIVFDDVDESDQLDDLIGRRKQLFRGSKVIVTTRLECLPRAYEDFVKFQVKGLDANESLQLFSWQAFGQNHPTESYMECSMEAAHRCGGLPLALEVLGSSLSGRNINVWRDALRKLKVIPDSKIQRILRISYDSLKDDHDRNLFLHIACFFVGMDRNYLIGILEGCGFFTEVGIQNLIDKCLLSVDEKNKISMHQLLREMGREIVRQESTNDPGKRSRLWNEDACTVLKNKIGTEEIKGLVLSLHRLMTSYENTITAENNAEEQHLKDDLETESFKKMHNLQILQLNNVSVKGDFEDIPKNLVLLWWHGFPLRSVPTNFCLKKLVSLDLSYSDLKSVWDGTKDLPELKFLNLSHCRYLTRSPNFCGCTRLERLVFRCCIKMFEVDESIECLSRLIILDVNGCKNLRRFPKQVSTLKSLEELNLSGCSNLEELPKDLGKLKSLKSFHVPRRAAKKLLSTTIKARIVRLLSSRLRHPVFQSWLTLRKGSRSTSFSLTSLPCSLVHLSLAYCNLSDDAIPSELSSLRSLTDLNLSGNPFHSLPESINSLTMLKVLSLNHCTRVQSLPKLPISLQFLEANNCSSLERIASPQDLLKLFELDVVHCDSLVEIQDLFKIESVNNADKAILESLGLSNLESLANAEVDMFNGLTFSQKTTSPQVLHEWGIVSIFVPGNDIPNCFSPQCMGPRISFEVLSLDGYRICGLNLGISYGLQHDVKDLAANPLFVKITNITKQARWSYNPTCYAIPRDEMDILWLSQWTFGDQLKEGDEMHVSVITPNNFYAKKCGVSLIYEAQHERIQSREEIIGGSPWNQITIDSAWKMGALFMYLLGETSESSPHVSIEERSGHVQEVFTLFRRESFTPTSLKIEGWKLKACSCIDRALCRVCNCSCYCHIDLCCSDSSYIPTRFRTLFTDSLALL